MPTVLLIRHAQASFGARDYDVLSQRGHDQVRALVAGLARRGVQATTVVAGDLRRQRDTAEPCAAAAGVAVAADSRFNEYDDRDILGCHGDGFTGLERREGDRPVDSREFQRILESALAAWIEAEAASACREPWPRFQARATAAVQDLAAGLHRGQTALAITSGGTIAAVTAALMGLPALTVIAFNRVSVNTAITKLAVGRGGITVVTINDHAHLEEARAGLISYR